MTEDIEETVDNFLGIARNQLDSMETKIKRCDIIGIIDSYALVSANLLNASNWIPDLPSATRSRKMEEVHEIHDKKHDLVKTIANFCKCEAKEPFRYVEKPD